MRFNEKWAEYSAGGDPLQVRLLGKKSVLSNEAIAGQIKRSVPKLEKIERFQI